MAESPVPQETDENKIILWHARNARLVSARKARDAALAEYAEAMALIDRDFPSAVPVSVEAGTDEAEINVPAGYSGTDEDVYEVAAASAQRKAGNPAESAPWLWAPDDAEFRAAVDAALAWERARTADAVKAIMHVRSIMALSATDWGATYNHAIMWAILFGWDGEPDIPGDGGAWDQLAARYHWDADLVARLRHERAAIAALVGIEAGRG